MHPNHGKDCSGGASVKRFSQYRQPKLIQFGGYFATVCLSFVFVIPAHAQGADSNNLEVYNGCGMEGDARSSGVQALNRLKNRYAPPHQIDPAITLAAILAPGRDTGRWKVKQGAEIVGYVFDVKVGGIESTNCHARGAEQRDTHIELVLDPMAGSPTQRVIVEVTPRWRTIMAAQGVDSSTRALRDRLLGRWVKVRGWMLFDVEHQNASANTAPGRERNWRATAWEIHPITSIEVVPRPAR
jgi:hypothetical protein